MMWSQEISRNDWDPNEGNSALLDQTLSAGSAGTPQETTAPTLAAAATSEALQPPTPPEQIVTAIGNKATGFTATDSSDSRKLEQRSQDVDPADIKECTIDIPDYIERAINILGPVATLRRSQEVKDAILNVLDRPGLPIRELKGALCRDPRVQVITRQRPDGSEIVMYYRVFPNGSESPDGQALLEVEATFNGVLGEIDASWKQNKFSVAEYLKHCARTAAAMPEVAKLLEHPGAQQMFDLLSSQKAEARLAANAEFRKQKNNLLQGLLRNQDTSLACTLGYATQWACKYSGLLTKVSPDEARALLKPALAAAAADESNTRVYSLPHERYLVVGLRDVGKEFQVERYLVISAHLDEAMIQAQAVQDQPHKEVVLELLESMLINDGSPGLIHAERAFAVRLLYSHPWWKRNISKVIVPSSSHRASPVVPPKGNRKKEATPASPAEHAAARVAHAVMEEGYVSITAARCVRIGRSLGVDFSGELDEGAVIAQLSKHPAFTPRTDDPTTFDIRLPEQAAAPNRGHVRNLNLEVVAPTAAAADVTQRQAPDNSDLTGRPRHKKHVDKYGSLNSNNQE